MTTNKFLCLSFILLVFAYGKEEIVSNQIIDTTNTIGAIKEKSTGLKNGFTSKKKDLRSQKTGYQRRTQHSGQNTE